MKKCKEYHNWEIVSVSGTLPHQEVELQCPDCELIENVYFEVE